MPSEFEIEVAIAVMDLLTNRLNATVKKGEGFDNDTVIFMIKTWTKVGMLTHGPSFHKKTSALYVMERDPTPTKEKRSRMLLLALQAFEGVLIKHKTTEGDFFEGANREMLQFVWDYRKGTKTSTNKRTSPMEFKAFLMKWLSTSAEDAMKAVQVGMEKHA